MSRATNLAVAPESEEAVESISVLGGWQNLPLSLIMLSWMNDDFKKEFLKRPTKLLRDMLVECPKDKVFCVLENTLSERHLVLPFRDEATFGWSHERIAERLQHELVEPSSLEYGLPPRVIASAFSNPLFKRQLIVAPKEVLAAMGYQVGSHEYYVHENTEFTVHLTIPYNKWEKEEVSDDELQELLLHDIEPVVWH